MAEFPVVQRATKVLDGIDFEFELRVARRTSVLIARAWLAAEGRWGAWQTWHGWDTPADDPVGAGVREAARFVLVEWA